MEVFIVAVFALLAWGAVNRNANKASDQKWSDQHRPPVVKVVKRHCCAEHGRKVIVVR